MGCCVLFHFMRRDNIIMSIAYRRLRLLQLKYSCLFLVGSSLTTWYYILGLSFFNAFWCMLFFCAVSTIWSFSSHCWPWWEWAQLVSIIFLTIFTSYLWINVIQQMVKLNLFFIFLYICQFVFRICFSIFYQYAATDANNDLVANDSLLLQNMILHY